MNLRQAAEMALKYFEDAHGLEDTLEPWLINEYIVKTTEAIRARGEI